MKEKRYQNMANKAIDKAYLQQQFVNFNKDVVNKRYITKLGTIPVGKRTGVSENDFIYNEDQYSLYNDNIVQWIGTSQTITLRPNSDSPVEVSANTGYFYKIEMVEGTDTDAGWYAIDSLTAVKVQDETGYGAGEGIQIADSASGDGSKTISALVYTSNTYNEDILRTIDQGTISCGNQSIIFQNRSRVDSVYTMEEMADANYTSESDGVQLGYIVQYIGDDEQPSVSPGEEEDPGEGEDPGYDYTPTLLKNGQFYKLVDATVDNNRPHWVPTYPISIDDRYNANSNLSISENGLLDNSHMDALGLTAFITNQGTQAFSVIFQFVGADTQYRYSGGNINLYEGRFYKVTSSGGDPAILSITEMGAQKEVEYTIGEAPTVTEGYLKTYQLYKTVDGGSPEAVSGSVINIPKDFLVKSASVRTYTAVGGFWYKGLWYSYNSTNDSFVNGTTELFLDTSDYTVSGSAVTAFGSTWPKSVYDAAARTTAIGSVSADDCVVAWASGEGTGNIEGNKYIDFVINVKTGSATDEHMYLALGDLVQTYSAGAGISISSDNIISLDFQYETLPTYSSNLPLAIQYIGADDVDTTDAGYTGAAASPTLLQAGGFYKYDTTNNVWVLINTAKEDVDIDFSLSDFS